MRRRILDAAAELLAREGYKATTLRGIADAAGLKAASIYYHFASKEHITVEILNEGVGLVSDAVAHSGTALPDGAGGKEILASAINAHLDALFERRAYVRASIRCFSMVPENIREQSVSIRREFDKVWLTVLKRAHKAGGLPDHIDLKYLHLIILGSLNWTIEWRGISPAEKQALTSALLNTICR
jgi:AcrR family transcriptional regulator